MGRPNNSPPLARTADEVTEEHINWVHNRFIGMYREGVRTDQRKFVTVSLGMLTSYFTRVLRAKAKDEVLSRLTERGVLRMVQKVNQTQRRVETTTYFELVEPVK